MGRQSIFPVRAVRARRPARIDIVQAIDAPLSPGLRPESVTKRIVRPGGEVKSAPEAMRTIFPALGVQRGVRG